MAGLSLSVRELHCRYADPDTRALSGVSLSAAPGETVVVMGESGAGKSTLLRCINGLVPSLTAAECRGQIVLDAVPILGQPVGRLAGRVAMVFQDFEAQLFSTNVRLEVAFGPEQLGIPPAEIERRVATNLALVDLADCTTRDPSTLSGGQKQRLAIASILAMHPGVLLLDEAATDLDPVGRRELYDTLHRLRRGRLTMVAVEHEIDPVMGADDLVLMQRGRVAGRGRPAELVRDVALFERCGVRPHDLALLGATLGIDLPLDVETAIERLRPRVPTRSTNGPLVPGSRPGQRMILEVDQLGCGYGGTEPVLQNVSVGIGAGEFIALIGQNGCGKTTLAKHLNGLLRPEAGTVRLDGVDLQTLPLERVAPEVGYVFQNPDHQLFASTVAEEVAFGPRNFGLTGAELEQRVTDTLTAVDLLALRDEDPFLLNKGARQQLAVATVLAMAPRVLILDEPTTGLDYPQQRRMLDLLARLHAGGTSIIVITHSPWVVAEYAERALLVGEGCVLFDGPLATLLADDALLAAAAFELPPITRVARALDLHARDVASVARALGAGGG